MEKDYYKRTKIYPIMHTVVIRATCTSTIRGWRSISTRRSAAPRTHCYRSITDTGSPKASFAWLQPMIEEEKRIIGEDWYPYGIEKNRPTLEALLQYTHEHGLTDRRVKIEDIVRAVDHARHSAERRAARLGLSPSFRARAA